MESIDSSFLCHCLSITLKVKPVIQKRRELCEEKKKVAREEIDKLLKVDRI